MDGQRQKTVESYWRYRQLIEGDCAQRLAADDLWWAVEAVWDAIEHSRVDQVMDLLDQLISAPGADPVFFGAGPLEDLLRDRPEAADAVARCCRRSPAWSLWRRATAAVWLTGDDYDRFPSLAPCLSGPIDRP